MPYKLWLRQIVCLAICCLHFLIRLTYANIDTRNKDAAEIYPYPVFTKYTPNKVYPAEPIQITTSVDFLSVYSHLVFDTLIKDTAGLPPGYITKLSGSNTLNLGPNIEHNDWAKFLGHYWVFNICIFILLIFVIIVPFIAVCYCCFKAYRCSGGCPNCDWYKDARQRCTYGLILAVLLIGILFGAAIAFQTSLMLNRGLGETSGVVQRGTQTFCVFLKDVSNHVHHLFSYNCEELITNLVYVIKNLHKLLFSATMERFDKKKNLSRPFDKMLESAQLMREVVGWHQDLVFLGVQLRDGLRSVKRDIVYTCTVLCGNEECLRFLKASNVHQLDSSKCLHFDMLPDPIMWAEAMEEVHKADYYAPKQKCDNLLMETKWLYGLGKLMDPLIKYVDKGKDFFRIQGDSLRNIIDQVVTQLHANTVKSTGSFDDIYGKFNTHRNIVNATAGGFLLFILMLLLIALIFGCCGRRRRGYQEGFCNNISGARLLCLSIIFMFSVFSFIVLLGIFYLVLGLITYMGVCAPLRYPQGNSLTRQLDSLLDFSEFQARSNEPETELPQMRVSKAISNCKANQTIMQLLKDLKIYDPEDLFKTEIIGPLEIPNDAFFAPFDTIKETNCFINYTDNTNIFEKLYESKLAPYNGTSFTDHLCLNVTPVPLPNLITQLKDLRSSLWTQWGLYDWARISLYDDIAALQEYQDKFYFKVLELIAKITKNILQIDDYILFERKPFGESMKIIVDYSVEQEKDSRQKAAATNIELRRKVQEHLEDQFLEFIRMIIKESKTNLGNCEPIAKTYTTSVEKICQRIVDPLNSLAIGFILSGLLLLPTLVVAHRLMCLYSKIYPRGPIDEFFDCPTCSGGATKPPLSNLEVEDPSQCACNEVFDNRHQDETAIGEQKTSLEVTVHEEPSISGNSKRKED